MDDWENFNETSLSEKEDFYDHLNMEPITVEDYKHAEKVCKDFEINNLGKYNDLHVQWDVLLLFDVFNNFQDMSLETYELDPAGFPSASGLAWQRGFKKANIKLDLLTDSDMLLNDRKRY